MHWDGTQASRDAIIDWTAANGAIIDTDHIEHLWDYDKGCYVLPSGKTIHAPYGERCLIVMTLEGEMVARPGDWIIKGTEGEFYPCKDSVFQRKYTDNRDLEKAEADCCEEAKVESSILLTTHPYAEGLYYLEHHNGPLLLSRHDLEELYNQLDQHLYPNPGHETALPVSTRRG